MRTEFNLNAKISTLQDFYRVMNEIQFLKRRLTVQIFSGHKPKNSMVQELRFYLKAIEDVSRYNRLSLSLNDGSPMELNASYEISELEKDLYFLENGEEQFLEYLAYGRYYFKFYLEQSYNWLKGKKFGYLITDRDGTTTNYCGRYQSSIQSVYNALFLSRFARKLCRRAVYVTSAPLQNPGIYNVSVHPEGHFIYAASKGREFIDDKGSLHSSPIEPQKQQLIDRLYEELVKLTNRRAFEKFKLIGSGLQRKFGQLTIARQDVTRSIKEEDSLLFFDLVRTLVKRIDPEQLNFRIEDTKLDIEIILTIEDEKTKVKDFDKGDGVRFIAERLKLDLSRGPHLVCGDTSSDIPLIEGALAGHSEVYAIFVTRDEKLQSKIRQIYPDTLFVPEPDILVCLLNELSKQEL